MQGLGRVPHMFPEMRWGGRCPALPERRIRFGGCLLEAQTDNGDMGTATHDTYTAKLTDGPLEGKTVTTEFLDSGDPRPRIEIPSDSLGKRYLYARAAGLEFDSTDHPERPTAVDYRYLEAVFETSGSSS